MASYLLGKKEIILYTPHILTYTFTIHGGKKEIWL